MTAHDRHLMRLLAFSPLLNAATSFLTYVHVYDGSTSCSIPRQFQLNKSSAVRSTYCRRQRWHQHTAYGQVDDCSDVEQAHRAQLPIQPYWKLPRLYVSPSRLAENTFVTLSPEQTHYLTKVMRFLKKGKSNSDDVANRKECVRVFNGRDGEWLAKVYAPPQTDEDSRKRRRRRDEVILLEVECLVELRKQSINDDHPWIIFSPLKNQNRMKLIIEKCTELGVGAIILAKSDRMDGTILSSLSVPSNGSDNLDHIYGTKVKSREENVSVEKLKLQAIEASEQSERLCIPSITTDFSFIDVSCNAPNDVFSVKDIVGLWRSGLHQKNNESRKLLICRERGEESNTVKPLLTALGENEKVAFLIGPEGGWSPEEESLFDHVCQQESNKNSSIHCVSLGSSVLRAETACMMAVGACSLTHDLSQNN